MSACDGCAGMLQQAYEPTRYSVRHRKWLCAECRRAIDIPVGKVDYDAMNSGD